MKEMLEAIAEEIRNCTRCPLAERRTKAVPGDGPANADIMFIGEGPGAAEDRKGLPFVGPAGKLLDELLHDAGLRRDQVFITNIIKCRPPGNRDPRPEEIRACRDYLDGQIAAINPQVICPLGRPATQALLDPKATMSKVHGRPFERDGILYVPIYHPAAALHNPTLRPALVEDFKKLKALLDQHLA